MSEVFEKALPRQGGLFRELSVKEVFGELHKVRLVDVRELDEYRGELGHAPGAELVPLATVPTHARDWPREQTVAVICRSGRRSESAALTLHNLGFKRVINVAGGMLAWNAHGLPVER